MIGQKICIQEDGNGLLIISQPVRSLGADGLGQMGQRWIQEIMQETEKRARVIAHGKTCYLASVYGNVIALSIISGVPPLCARTVSIVNLLDCNDDVFNGIKLGLFLSGACREECLTVIEKLSNIVENHCGSLLLCVDSDFPITSPGSGKGNTRVETLNTKSGDPDLNYSADSNAVFSQYDVKDQDEEAQKEAEEAESSTSVVILDLLEITGVVKSVSKYEQKYETKGWPVVSRPRPASVLGPSSDSKSLDDMQARLSRIRERKSRRNEARAEQYQKRHCKRRKVSHSLSN